MVSCSVSQLGYVTVLEGPAIPISKYQTNFVLLQKHLDVVFSNQGCLKFCDFRGCNNLRFSLESMHETPSSLHHIFFTSCLFEAKRPPGCVKGSSAEESGVFLQNVA